MRRPTAYGGYYYLCLWVMGYRFGDTCLGMVVSSGTTSDAVWFMRENKILGPYCLPSVDV